MGIEGLGDNAKHQMFIVSFNEMKGRASLVWLNFMAYQQL